MIKLSEILHTVKDESKEGFTPIDNWNMLHAVFLEDMDFKPDGAHHYSLNKPKISVSHKKGSGFIVEDKTKKQVHTFKSFDEVSNFFTNYNQKWENSPYEQQEEEEQQKEIEQSKPEKKPNTAYNGPDYKNDIKKWERM
jgi:hypothetical protein